MIIITSTYNAKIIEKFFGVSHKRLKDRLLKNIKPYSKSESEAIQKFLQTPTDGF